MLGKHSLVDSLYAGECALKTQNEHCFLFMHVRQRRIATHRSLTKKTEKSTVNLCCALVYLFLHLIYSNHRLQHEITANVYTDSGHFCFTFDSLDRIRTHTQTDASAPNKLNTCVGISGHWLVHSPAVVHAKFSRYGKVFYAYACVFRVCCGITMNAKNRYKNNCASRPNWKFLHTN